MRSAYEDREAEARARHAAGEKVVGYIGAGVPVEMITAAGLVPLRLVGDPARETTRADAYMEPVREGYLRALLEKLLAGDYGFLDLIIVPRSSEGALQFYYLVEHIRTSEPDRVLPSLHLFDLLQTPLPYTQRYVVARLEDLRARLATVAGRAVTDARIATAIAAHDDLRERFRTLNERRRAHSPQLSGTEALALAGICQCLPIEMARDWLTTTSSFAAPPGTGPRLMVKGSPVEHAGLYEAIEANGAVVVADDHEWGEGLYHHAVGQAGPPLERLALHYMRNVPGPRRLPQSLADAEFLARVRASDARGVIFNLEAHDDTLGWDYPAQKRALDAMGIRSLLLTGQSYRGIGAETRAAIAAFIEELSA